MSCFYYKILLWCPKKYPTKFYLYFILKIPNKRDLQEIAYNHSSNIDFKDIYELYKKCTAKSYSFLVIDATIALDNLSERLERIF